MGLVVRLLVAAVSFGTRDAPTFLRFGMRIDDDGLLATYQHDPDLNHPPLPATWAWAAYRLTAGGNAFPFVFKLPVIAVEAITVWLLWRRWRDAASAASGRGAAAVAGYALSLCAILVSGFHCNTDTVYGAFCLLSIWLLESKRPLSAGLALAAAVNVKLIPVLLIPAVVLSLRTRRDAMRFIGGLSVGVLPFIPVLIAVGPSFYANALAYGSYLDKWGIQFFLLPSADTNLSEAGAGIAYYNYGKYPLLAALVAFAVVARWLGRWDRYEVATVTFSLFLVFAPGFGVQYTVILLPLMFATRPLIANVYSVAAGAFLATVYALTLTESFPLYSEFNTLFPQPSTWLGLAAWLVLVYYVATTLARRRPADAL